MEGFENRREEDHLAYIGHRQDEPARRPGRVKILRIVDGSLDSPQGRDEIPINKVGTLRRDHPFPLPDEELVLEDSAQLRQAVAYRRLRQIECPGRCAHAAVFVNRYEEADEVEIELSHAP
jgi:hypothetical protein